MRSIRRAELGLALALCLCACPALPDGPRYRGAGNAQPVRGGTLMMWEEARVRMLDPHIAFDQISGVLITMLYDALYSYDRDVKLVPAIASALPQISEDGRSLIVPLRRGVRFHNGRELTARDVLWSFERMLHPDLHSPGAPYYRAIVGFAAYQAKQAPHLAGLSAPDPYTFRIELERPDQSFVYTLAMRFAAPMPREEVEKPGSDMRRRPVGTGPFRMATWDPGVRIVLERHAQYYEPGRPYLDRVVFEEGLKKDTAFMRFRNGEVDIVPRMSPADSMLMRTKPWKAFAAVVPQADVFAMFLNVELAPFDNVHVRRAVAMAIDRERWARARNFSIRPAGQILPPKVMGHDAKLPHLQRFDLSLARQEMKLAGLPDGLREPVTLWTNDSSAGRQYGELFQADMAKIGIEVQLKPVSFPVYLEETGKPKTAQIVAGGWSMDFPDPSNIFNLVSRAGIAQQDSMNRSFFSAPELDALLDEAIVERDPKRREAMYREANDFVAQAAPWAIHSNTQALQAWQPYVKGYAPHPMHWLGVHDVWLDLPRQRIAQLFGGEAGRQLAMLFPLPLSPAPGSAPW
ncbi:MAG: Dipeptide-binding transporter, periplasmic substrate-binding component [Myxococcaceae bacterium]|nr:Dipeptide-binding transporter, periplasmic substrate-binding component [Myxococcaceae bacterium]